MLIPRFSLASTSRSFMGSVPLGLVRQILGRLARVQFAGDHVSGQASAVLAIVGGRTVNLRKTSLAGRF